jgi:hypothetical protein
MSLARMLDRRQPLRPALRLDKPGRRALTDQRTFELCDGAEHMKVSIPRCLVVSMLSVGDTSPIFSPSNSSAFAISFLGD